MPSIGCCSTPSITAGGSIPTSLEHGRHDVDGVHVLAPDLAPGGDAAGPVDDQRIGDPALVRLALPAPERRVAGDRPPPRVVVVDARPADLVDALGRLLHGAGQHVPDPAVVERPGRPALRRRAVVGQHEHQRVVELADSSSQVEHPADLRVGVGQEAGERLHVAGVDAARRSDSESQAGTQSGRGDSSVCAGSEAQLRSGGRAVPRATRPSRRRSARGSARSTRPGPGAASGRRRWRGRGTTACRGRRGAGPRGTRWRGRPGPRSGGSRPSPSCGGGTEWLSWTSAGANWWVSPPKKPYQRSKPRPSGQRSRRAAQVQLVLGGEVPLADGVGGVAVGGEHRGQQAAAARDAGVVAGEPGGQVGDAAHAARVVVAPGQHAGPGRRAQRGGVEVARSAGPPAASRSKVGVSMSEPKQPSCANPTSSSTTTSTLGAPSGGRDRRPPRLRVPVYRPIRPWNSPVSMPTLVSA